MIIVHTASGGAMEADMRIIGATFTGLVVLTDVSVQTTPLPPVNTGFR